MGSTKNPTRPRVKMLYKTHEQALKVYELYQQLWIFRVRHYWKILVYFSLLVYAVILFPYLYEIFGVQHNLLDVPISVHFLSGLILSTLEWMLLLAESARQIAAKEDMDRIMASISTKYSKTPVENLTNIHQWPFLTLHYSNMIAYVNFGLQLMLLVFMFFHAYDIAIIPIRA